MGSTREIPVDIRLVTATNENLEAAIARGSFRADLFHRINEFTLRMPELREMRGDILLFADFFLDQANRELGKRIVGFDAEAVAALTRCEWPGNLRQLKNAVKSATLLASGDYITCRELPAEVTAAAPAAPEFRCATRLRRRSRSGVRCLLPAATSRRRPSCWGSTARPSTTNCTSTASSEPNVEFFHTFVWSFSTDFHTGRMPVRRFCLGAFY